MKKIVHIAQSPGGVLEYIYMFLKEIKKYNEYENILIVSEEYREQEDRLKKYATEIYYLPMIREIQLKADMSCIFKINKLLKQIKPDIVYLHSSKAGALGRIALLFNFKTKIIYNAHGWYFTAKISEKKKRIFAFIEKILAIKTHKIVNISQNEYEAAFKYKVASKNKMCVIENGIDLERFENLEQYREEYRNKFNLFDNDIVIGVLGRISEQKDPMTTIKAFNILRKKYNNLKLMYIGDGDLKEDVLKYAEENKLKQDIIITGWVNKSERYLSAIDVAILPSKWEGFGLAIVEYMAAGKPIVATRVGGIQNIIKSDENGILINLESEQELADSIEKYITDERYKENIIKENKKYVIEKYSICRLINCTIDIIKKEG